MTGHPSTSCAEQFANFRPGLLNFFLKGVGVDIQRGGDIGMAADALDRLEVDVRLRQGRNADCDFDELPQYMEYYKLSEIRLAYNPVDMARDEDDQQ